MNLFFFNLVEGIRERWRSLFGRRQTVDGGDLQRLYVGNLSFSAKEEDLKDLFSRFGKVHSVHLIRDRLTRKLKGYAFVEMGRSEALQALSLNGNEFLGRKIVVSEAKSRRGGGPPPKQRLRERGSRWRRRSGPRVYRGPEKDKPTIQRFE